MRQLSHRMSVNSTNAVGGLFHTQPTQKRLPPLVPNPTNAVGGFVHTQPNSTVGFTLRLIKARLGMKNPPTALGGFRTRAQCLLRRPIMNDPPTALVEFELNTHD